MQQSTNIVNYACGNSCIVCVDSYGDAFGLGNNEFNQLQLKGEYFTKTFKKIPDQILGKIKKAFCIGDCTFFENYDEEIYFAGKYTHNSTFCLILQNKSTTNWDKLNFQAKSETW